MYRYHGNEMIITGQSLDIGGKLRAVNVLATSFPIEISWQSCGNVLAGDLQRLMTYMWVYRVINCVFQALSFSLNLFHRRLLLSSLSLWRIFCRFWKIWSNLSGSIFFSQLLILILELRLRRNICEFRVCMITRLGFFSRALMTFFSWM